jgi:hypothetical protein
MKRGGGNTNFLRLNHKIESSQATPSRLGDESPRVTDQGDRQVRLDMGWLWMSRTSLARGPDKFSWDSSFELFNVD